MSTFNTMNIFGLQTFCVVTGGSKGFGRRLGVRFAAKLPVDSVILLLARSESGLAETRAIIESESPHVKVLTVTADLGDYDSAAFEQIVKQALRDVSRDPDTFDQALIVHNAASLGDVSKDFDGQDSKKHLNEYWNMNLTSFTLLNTAFLKIFPEDSVTQRVVVGVSSICALQPFKSWSLYCAGKAARDMLLRTMALETPSVRVLNYAPGPIDTDMQLLARTQTKDSELRNMFIDFKDNQKLLTCDQSLDKLIPFLEKNSFDSGAHIDYYDI